MARQLSLTTRKRRFQWVDTTQNEIKMYLGLCCLSGNIKFRTLSKQWSKDPLYNHQVFGKSMSRNRLTNILRILRLVNHATIDKEDRLFKIRSVLNSVIQNIKSVYYPGKHLAVGEAMILWRGRLVFREYISNNRHKYGIKLYELTAHDGFILNIIVYVGKGTLAIETSSHSVSVVNEWLDGYLDNGHILYLDNL